MISEKFLSLKNLIGEKKQKKLSDSHVCLIGLGGVGSWVAEALARSGMGKLTLIDMDHIVASNINRQVQATELILVSQNFRHLVIEFIRLTLIAN